MPTPTSVTPKQESVLERFVARMPDDMQFRGVATLRGFLFIVNSTPDMALPSHWLDYLLGVGYDDQIVFKDRADAEATTKALLALSDEAVTEAFDSPDDYPAGCELREPAIDNAEANTPLSQWLTGAFCALAWLETSLIEELGEEPFRQIMGRLAGMGAFLNRTALEHSYGERPEAMADYTVEEYADVMLEAFPYFRGELIERLQPELGEFDEPPPEPARSTKVGRNEPCPCGSGKKYKKCCGAAGAR